MDSMRFEWIEVNRGEMRWNEWIDGIDLEQPYENGPMVERGQPYENDLNEPYEKVPIKMNGFIEKWVNRVDRTIWDEMSELKEWLGTTLWEWSYGQKKVSLWEWLEWT